MNEPIEVSKMKEILDHEFNTLWGHSFGIIDSGDLYLGNMRVTKDNKKEIAELKGKIAGMEAEVKEYHEECRKHFSSEMLEVMEDDLDAFKNSIFGEKLWTVRSSLHDMRNPELDRYRESFENATPREIYTCVNSILDESKKYVTEVFPKINLRRVLKIEDLRLDYLNEEDFLLTGVIGLGIRSELLHRMFPRVFPIMTRRSLWGMFFLTNQNEFVVDENKNGRSRTSHEWNYEYPRFCLYSNYLSNLMEHKLKEYNITMKEEIRFGYVNLMLVAFARKYKEEIAKLYTWQYTGLA